MPYALDVKSAAADANDPDFETFDEVYDIFNRIDQSASRRSVDVTYPTRDGLVLASGELGAMKSVTMRVDAATGSFVFSYAPPTRNPWTSYEAELTAIFKPYVYNPDAIAAQARSRESRGMLGVMKPGEEGLEVGSQYLPPGVPANVLGFLTGEKGSVAQQKTTLKAKATGKGRRKTRKSKTRASRRTSLGRKTRRR